MPHVRLASFVKVSEKAQGKTAKAQTKKSLIVQGRCGTGACSQTSYTEKRVAAVHLSAVKPTCVLGAAVQALDTVSSSINPSKHIEPVECATVVSRASRGAVEHGYRSPLKVHMAGPLHVHVQGATQSHYAGHDKHMPIRGGCASIWRSALRCRPLLNFAQHSNHTQVLRDRAIT